MIKGAISKQTV